MNYYQARQRDSDSRWDFTCANNGHVFPVGYCAPWRDWPDDLKIMGAVQYERYVKNQLKHHEGGHATKEDAERCYYQYEVENHLREMSCQPDEAHRCQYPDCGTWTHLGVEVSLQPAWLCAIHMAEPEDSWKKVHPFSPGRQIISSW